MFSVHSAHKPQNIKKEMIQHTFLITKYRPEKASATELISGRAQLPSASSSFHINFFCLMTTGRGLWLYPLRISPAMFAHSFNKHLTKYALYQALCLSNDGNAWHSRTGKSTFIISSKDWFRKRDTIYIKFLKLESNFKEC